LQGLCTPREVFVAIAAEGYQISYRRVPMSRERTPQAGDLDLLLAQMGNHPAGREVRQGRWVGGWVVSWLGLGLAERAVGGMLCCSIQQAA
jgi:hypothetical protein